MSLEDEIDLRAYISVLLKFKYWIVGLAFLSAVVAMAASFLLPPTYQAAALVAITEPRYTMQFDPRFESVNDIVPPYKAYPPLAMGDQIIAGLIEQLGSQLEPEERGYTAFRNMLDASNGSDPSIVKLAVKNGDPQRSAIIANLWAELFVDTTNDLYGQSKEELAFFEAQLVEAKDTLGEAEQALIDFQAHNEEGILSTQLNNKRAALNDYLSAARSLALIVQDAKSLQDRLRSQDAALSTSLSDELTSLFLEIDALNRGNLPIQLQISGQPGLSNRTIGEQVAFLDSLIQVLGNKQVTLEEQAQSLEPAILSLQQAVEQVRTEEDRLRRDKDVARETFITLSRKVAEAQIAAQNTVGDVRLASYAVVPDKPISPRKLINTVIGGALGLMVGVFGAFAIEYWRQGDQGQIPS